MKLIEGNYYTYSVGNYKFILLYREMSDNHYVFTVIKSSSRNYKKGSRGTLDIKYDGDLVEIEEKTCYSGVVMRLVEGNYYKYGWERGEAKYILKYIGRSDKKEWFIVSKSFGNSHKKQGFRGYIGDDTLYRLVPISESEAVFEAL